MVRTSTVAKRIRLGVLLVLLGLSLMAFRGRERVQRWLAHEPLDADVMQGHLAHELPTLRTLDGPPVHLASLRGQVVLLHFWTFGCSNCEHMVPYYTQWDRELRARGLRVIGVHAPETPHEADETALRSFVQTHGIGWTVVIDPDFEAWHAFHVQGWPTMVLIDRRGVVRHVVLGDNQPSTVHEEIEALLREGT